MHYKQINAAFGRKGLIAKSNAYNSEKEVVRWAFSKKGDHVVAKKLEALMLDNPWLLQTTAFSRSGQQSLSLWQLLISVNRINVLAFLLEKFPQMAGVPNQYGHTLMHAAIPNPPLLAKVCASAAALVNKADFTGNNPLHWAVMNGYIQSVDILLSHTDVDRFARNSAQHSVFQLGAENKEILDTLLNVSHGNGLRSTPPNRKALLEKIIPTLAQPSAAGLDLLDAVQAPHTGTSAETASAGMSALSWEEQSAMMVVLLHHLQDACNAQCDAALSQRLCQQFVDTATEVPLFAKDGLRSLLNGMTLSFKLKTQLLTAMSQRISVLHRPIVTLEEQIKRTFYIWLSNGNHHQPANQKAKPNFQHKSGRASRQALMQTLWDFLQEPQNPTDIELVLLALRSRQSSGEIVFCIGRLYHNMTSYQQGIAQYMVFNVLKEHPWDVQKNASKSFAYFIRRCQRAAKKNPSAPVFHNDILTLNKAKKTPDRLRLAENFTQLQRHFGEEKSPCSFEALLDQALKKPVKHRQEEVRIIARELFNVSRHYYQQQPLQELAQNNADERVHTNAFIAYFNRLNTILVKKILEQPKAKLHTALTLLPQIADALCDLSEENAYADLTGLMLIFSVISRSPIARLTQYWDKLSKRDATIVHELEILCTLEGNFRNLRILENTVSTALPCISIVLRDLIFAQEGNEHKEQRLHFQGKILSKIQRTQQQQAFKPVLFYSDLPTLMLNDSPINNAELEALSQSLQPRKMGDKSRSKGNVHQAVSMRSGRQFFERDYGETAHNAPQNNPSPPNPSSFATLRLDRPDNGSATGPR